MHGKWSEKEKGANSCETTYKGIRWWFLSCCMHKRHQQENKQLNEIEKWWLVNNCALSWTNRWVWSRMRERNCQVGACNAKCFKKRQCLYEKEKGFIRSHNFTKQEVCGLMREEGYLHWHEKWINKKLHLHFLFYNKMV